MTHIGRRRRSTAFASLLAAAALVLTACAGSTGTDSSNGQSSAAGGQASGGASPSSAGAGGTDGSGGGTPASSPGTPAPSTGGTYTVGLVAPLTGNFAQIGQDMQRGAELAIAEINAGGGLLGNKVELVTVDSQGEAGTGVSGMTRLISQNKVQAVLGPDLSGVVNATNAAQQACGCVWLMSGISPQNFELGNSWMFAGRPTDDVNAKIMADYAAKTLGVKKVALIYESNTYAQPTLPFIKQYNDEAGLQLVTEQAVQPDSTNLDTQVQAAMRAEADAIEFWGLIPNAAVLAKTVQKLGFEGPVFGANALVNKTTIDLAGSAANGLLAATTFSLENSDPDVQDFIKTYQAKYNEEPNDHAPLYFDMMNVLAKAVQDAGSTDPGAVRDALRSIEFSGVNGPIKYDEKGKDVAPSGVIVKVTDGKQTVIENVR
jgi:branched-chain amino acid transport system substrate-binding protein